MPHKRAKNATEPGRGVNFHLEDYESAELQRVATLRACAL